MNTLIDLSKEKRELYPLTSSQLGVYFACRKNPEGTMYNTPLACPLPKQIDIERLRSAVRTVAKNHQALSFVVDTDEGVPAMRPCEFDFEVPVVQVTQEELEQEKRKFIRPFDLERGPLCRFVIFETEKEYCFMMDYNHMVFDGTSTAVFARELEMAYAGQELEPEPFGQFHMSVYEEKYEHTEAYQNAKAYYEKIFSGVEANSKIEGDLPEDPNLADRPSHKFYADLSDQLRADQVSDYLKAQGIKESALFLGAFQYAIAKFSGQNENIICTVNHGRSDKSMAHMIGMMVRTLPLYYKINEEVSVVDYLKETQANLYNTIKYGNYPFVKLAGEYGLSADIMFAYQGDGFNTLRLDGETYDLRLVPVESALAPISVMVFKKHGSYEIEMDYRKDLYEYETIRSLTDMYVQILVEMLQKNTLAEIELLDANGREKIDTINRNSEVDHDLNKGFLELFREQVEKHPDKIALVYKENKYTYRELDILTDKIAGYLVQNGCCTGDFVPILVNRCEYMTICSIGVLKSGAAYEPLDPSHPMERISFMIQDASAKMLIAQKELLHLIPDYDGTVLTTEEIKDLPSCEKAENGPKAEDIFVLLYTSGTTGVPKGCMMNHRNITNLLHYLRKLFEITEESSTLAYASYGFDAHLMDIYPYLAFGGTEYIIPEENRLDLMWINEYCKENQITNIFMTTQVGRAFVTSIEDIAVKIVGTGGEKLVPLNPPEGIKLHNMYGPTECTVITTTFHVDKFYDPIPIGPAVDNAHLYVVDKQMRMLPVGAVGELCVAGPLVSCGYLNRPEQTEKVYVQNPFETGEDYQRLYHTGDIVKFMNDGKISYVGRRDGMVKIRGYRIELTEVEGVIREYSAVSDATVIAKDLESGGKAIMAYIVSDTQVDPEDLRRFIGEKKPYYMIPEGILQIDAIPLNVNGKVDKRKLPEISMGAATKKAEKTDRPMNTLEKKLAEIVAQIIGISAEEIDLTADLMYAGMTSLSIIKLAVEINKTFGYNAEVKDLMKGCSILSLESDIIEYLLHREIRTEENNRSEAESAPLSYAQFGVYSECMKNPYDTFYNIPFSYSFPLTFDAQKLAKAVEKVLLAHPYIFTRLTVEADDVVQTRQHLSEYPVPIRELLEEQLDSYKTDFLKPYHLMKSQLFRIEVVKTEKAIYLFSDFHHILFDGASFDIYMEAVKHAYEGKDVETEAYTYFDYVEDEKEKLNSQAFTDAKDYISDMLKNCESADEITPNLSGLPENGSPKLVSVPFDMEKITAFCAKHGVTPAHVFLASTLYVVSRFTNSRSAYINTISNGRSNMNLRNCFGMFVKTLPIGLEIEDVEAMELVHQAKDLMIRSIEHEIYPYADVCRMFSYAPNILYAYQIGVADDFCINGERIDKEPIGERRVKFKTGIYIEKNNGRDCVDILYNNALYSQQLMQTLAESIVTVTEKMIADPHQKVRKISLLDEAKAAMVESFSETGRREIETKLFHELFEKQAALHPQRIALIACDGTYTYEQLDTRANILAHNLLRRGVKTGSKIVLLLPRTSDYFAALFGVLKAGAAFIPTCPDYPKERIESILEDSEAEYMITTDAFADSYANALDVKTLQAGDLTDKPQVEVTPDDLAYLIYTSGSTGKPKGVMLSHYGIANYLTDDQHNLQVRYITENCTCYGSVTTVSFDMSLKEVAVTLCNGLTLAFANDEQTLDAVALTGFLAESKIDAFNATPSRLLVYMEIPEFAEVMKNCKVILSGGEKYSYKLLQILREKTDARILNTYGPTEITVSSNAKDLTEADEITIGKPLLNYKEYVVDLDDNKLPAGIVGELLIGGIGVALGYNKLPKQTEHAFIQYEGQRFYRSGDYARWTTDGDVVILGRKDNQVKIRGLRIELGEIEKCLTDIEGIRSGVIVIKKLGKEDGICAYYTADKQMDPEFLKAEMKKTLTDYMIPASFNQLEELPVTANGKVNLKALSEPVLQEQGEKQYEAPVTGAEKVFCRIFGDILDMDEVSVTDNFFDLGGTSLTVTRIVIAAAKENYEVSYGDIFENPTPKQLAKLVSQDAGDDAFGDVAHYDYSRIDRLLSQNTICSYRDGEKQKLGDVILTGAAGFLGIHVLHELLKNYDGKIYCLMRGKRKTSAYDRMKSMFFYYFEEDIAALYTDRVTVIDGDITNKEVFEKLKDCKADTFINCAANVKHFSKGTDIEDVNYHGVQNILEYCKETETRLVQVSTMSVGGVFLDHPGDVTHLKETQLYFGQALTSKYTYAKFLAEREVLQYAAEGLDAKIMRVGTLAARDSDGEYQINFTTNTFMGRLKSTYLVGGYPYESMDQPFELSPIDYVAKAILLLAQTPRECTVFHPFNNHQLLMNDLYTQMDQIGLKVSPMESTAYEKALEQAKEDPQKAEVLSSMIAYQNMAHGRKTYSVEKSNAYTMQVLYREGFRWPVTSHEYMKKFLIALQGLGFFDQE